MLCELATSHLKALHHGVPAGHQPDSLTEKQPPTHALDSQHSARESLSTPVPQNLTRLSIMLSSIRAAMQDSQTAWAQQIGPDHILKLMKDLSKSPAVVSWINELVDSASR